MGHKSKERADKIKIDRMFEDKDGVAPRLNELIRLQRWSTYALLGIAAMLAYFFLKDAIQGLLNLL